MKNNKEARIEIRLPEKDKEYLQNYCKEKNITISSFFRKCIENIKNGKKD